MRLEPVGKWIVGIAMIHKEPVERLIELYSAAPNMKGTTRFYLIEEASAEAQAAGFVPGDIVVPKHVGDLVLYNGRYHRGHFQLDEIIDRVRDVKLEEFTGLDGKSIVLPERLVERFAERIRVAA